MERQPATTTASDARRPPPQPQQDAVARHCQAASAAFLAGSYSDSLQQLQLAASAASQHSSQHPSQHPSPSAPAMMPTRLAHAMAVVQLYLDTQTRMRSRIQSQTPAQEQAHAHTADAQAGSAPHKGKRQAVHSAALAGRSTLPRLPSHEVSSSSARWTDDWLRLDAAMRDLRLTPASPAPQPLAASDDPVGHDGGIYADRRPQGAQAPGSRQEIGHGADDVDDDDDEDDEDEDASIARSIQLPPLLADTASIALTRAVIAFHRQWHHLAVCTLEPYMDNLESLDYGTGLRICMVYIDASLRLGHIGRAQAGVAAIKAVLVPLAEHDQMDRIGGGGDAAGSTGSMSASTVSASPSPSVSPMASRPGTSMGSHGSPTRSTPEPPGHPHVPGPASGSASRSVSPSHPQQQQQGPLASLGTGWLPSLHDHLQTLWHAIPSMYGGSLQLLQMVYSIRVLLAEWRHLSQHPLLGQPDSGTERYQQQQEQQQRRQHQIQLHVFEILDTAQATLDSIAEQADRSAAHTRLSSPGRNTPTPTPSAMPAPALASEAAPPTSASLAPCRNLLTSLRLEAVWLSDEPDRMQSCLGLMHHHIHGQPAHATNLATINATASARHSLSGQVGSAVPSWTDMPHWMRAHLSTMNAQTGAVSVAAAIERSTQDTSEGDLGGMDPDRAWPSADVAGSRRAWRSALYAATLAYLGNRPAESHRLYATLYASTRSETSTAPWSRVEAAVVTLRCVETCIQSSADHGMQADSVRAVRIAVVPLSINGGVRTEGSREAVLRMALRPRQVPRQVLQSCFQMLSLSVQTLDSSDRAMDDAGGVVGGEGDTRLLADGAETQQLWMLRNAMMVWMAYISVCLGRRK